MRLSPFDGLRRGKDPHPELVRRMSPSKHKHALFEPLLSLMHRSGPHRDRHRGDAAMVDCCRCVRELASPREWTGNRARNPFALCIRRNGRISFRVDTVLSGVALEAKCVRASVSWRAERFAIHGLTYGRVQEIFEPEACRLCRGRCRAAPQGVWCSRPARCGQARSSRRRARALRSRCSRFSAHGRFQARAAQAPSSARISLFFF